MSVSADRKLIHWGCADSKLTQMFYSPCLIFRQRQMCKERIMRGNAPQTSRRLGIQGSDALAQPSRNECSTVARTLAFQCSMRLIAFLIAPSDNAHRWLGVMATCHFTVGILVLDALPSAHISNRMKHWRSNASQSLCAVFA